MTPWATALAATVAAAVVVVTAAAGRGQEPRPRAAFRSATTTVSIYATVKDRGGRLVPDLRRDDFEVRDNGRPVELTVFSNEIQPITVALLLDMSGSMVPRFLRVRESTFKFIEALLPHDRLRIGTFGAEVSISPLLTGDKRVLHRVASEELWPGGGTPMWSAVDAALASLADETGRRVILILTDGADTGPLSGLEDRRTEAIRQTIREGFMVYAVGMQGIGLGADIIALSEDTGGGHHEIPSDDDLQATFIRIAEELRHQYVLGFTPAVLDGREHRLEIRLANRDLKARARRSYVAKAGGRP